MIEISQLLAPERIKLDMEAHRKSEALHELASLLHQAGAIGDAAALENGLADREKLASTGIGMGVAIPHLLTDMVSETVMAFGRKKEGVKFDSVDAQPARLFFLIIGPGRQQSAHLRLLSRLSRLLHSEELRQKLLAASSPEEVIEIIRRKEKEEGG